VGFGVQGLGLGVWRMVMIELCAFGA